MFFCGFAAVEGSLFMVHRELGRCDSMNYELSTMNLRSSQVEKVHRCVPGSYMMVNVASELVRFAGVMAAVPGYRLGKSDSEGKAYHALFLRVLRIGERHGATTEAEADIAVGVGVS